MPVCPSCRRASPEGNRFCPGCGRELPATTPPARQAGGPLVVATFGPSTGWLGKTITYDDHRFVLEGLGPIAAEAVLEFDRQGHLQWAYPGLREWAQRFVTAHPAAPMAPVAPAQQIWDPADGRQGGGGAGGGGRGGGPGAPSSGGRRRAWVLPTMLILGLALAVVLATILEGGYVRDGAGIAFALMSVALVVLVVWSLVRPESLGRGASPTASSRGPSRLLPVVLACLCVASVALAAVLWWMPHYQVIVPADKRVILDAKPALTVAVKNRGLFPGTYTATYAVAGREKSVVQLRLSPGEQQQVTLPVAAGTSTGPLTLRLGSAEIAAEVLRPAKFRVGALKVDPAIVKIGQVIRVRAAVENVGDVSGTFPGAMEANGHEADAQPTKIAPGDSTTLAFTVSQASAGACRLQLGAARATVMVVRPVRPPNGRMLRRSAGGGSAYLTVKNTNGLDAMVILTRTSAPRTPVLAVYVRRNSKATVNNVPDGRYIAWDCLGSDWNAYMQDFLTTEEHAKWRDPLVFSTSSSTSYWSDASYNYSQRHTNWTNWTLTLGSGSSKYTSVMSAQQFPKL